MKKTHAKTYIIIAIFLSIIGISIAYASLSQQLQIKTNTTVQSSQTSWNIVLKKEACYVSKFAKMGTMVIDGTSVTISGFTLQAPGDGFSCWLHVENKGEIAAKLSSINYTEPTFSGTGTSASADTKLISDNLIYGYGDTGIQKNDKLNPGDENRFGIGFSIRETMTSLPDNPVTFSITYTINFEQA